MPKDKMATYDPFKKNIKKRQSGGMNHLDAVVGAMGSLKNIQKTKKVKKAF